jgi:RNA polymerase sigma-70 factor (ECF subfamily)
LAGHDDARTRPEARYEAAESISLAFVVALQHLPPRQRCVLVLRDVLGFGTEEVAAILDATDASVKGALQRARATLRSRLGRASAEETALPPSKRERDVVSRFATAVEAGDVDLMVALLTDDAWLTMPPAPHQYQGHPAIAAFLADRACHRGANYRVVPTRANGQPALGCYLPGAHAATARAAGLMVLTMRGDRIAAITWFGDPTVIARFGLPATIRT